MLKVLGTAAIVFVLCTTAQAKENPWTGTEMTFDFYKKFVAEENCGEDTRDYLACISSIRILLRSIDPNLDLETQTTAPESGAAIVKSANNLVIVRRPKMDPKTARRLDAKASFEKQKKEFSDFIGKFSPAYYHYRKTSNFVMTELLQYIEKKHKAQLKEENIAEALNEYFHVASDPHSDFRVKKSLLENTTNAAEDFVGLGVGINMEEGGLLITDVYEGSGAEAAGLEPEDIITHVEGQKVNELTLESAVDRLRGKEGTLAKISIDRGGQKMDLQVTRKKIVLKVVKPKVISLFDQKIGYIAYSNFVYQKGCEEIAAALNEFNVANVHGAILDLRGNGGGSVGVANCIAGLFLGPNKVVVHLEENSFVGKIVRSLSTRNPQVFSKPLVLLINERSASASELIAGALKEHNRALIVGQTSFGKGSSQSPVSETEDMVFYATNGLFFQPSGKTNQTIGIEPHVKTFKSTTPKLSEIYAKREKDLYMFPLEPRQIEVEYSTAGFDTLQAPTACIESKNTEALYNSLSKKDANKDLQLLKGAASIVCM